MRNVLLLIKDVTVALLIIAATFTIGMVVTTELLTWPATTNVFGISMSFGLWLITVVGSGLVSRFRPGVIVLSMVYMILHIYVVFNDFSPATYTPSGVEIFPKYDLDPYTMAFALLTIICVAMAMALAKATEPYVIDGLKWLWSKVRAPAEPEAA